MSFRDALNATYLSPTKEERETLVAQLEELVVQAQKCASYKELRALAVRNIVAWLLFRHAHYAQNTCLHDLGMLGETKFTITQWVVNALADYLDHLKKHTHQPNNQARSWAPLGYRQHP
jgi:hypothetical protein